MPNDNREPLDVVVVEDEVLVRRVLILELTRLGYRVVGETGTGEKALELIPLVGCDFVIMDIRLAGELDGVETARRLWVKRKGVPILFCSAYEQDEVLGGLESAGPTGFLGKPVSTKALTGGISALLAGEHP